MLTQFARFLNTRDLPLRTLKTAAVMSISTGVAIGAASAATTGSAASAINTISHCVVGDDREFGDKLTTGETLLGLAANSAAMVFWSTLYELIPGRKSIATSIVPAAAAAAAAYVVDYHVVPKRYTPGFERVLPRRAIAAVYVAFAATLACTSLWNRDS